jgi:hypothetical protein
VLLTISYLIETDNTDLYVTDLEVFPRDSSE